MDTFLIILGGILLLTGFLGGILPVLPGPPVSFLGLSALHLTEQYDFTAKLLIIYAILSGVVVLLDYVIPVYGTKKFGASSYGTWGSGIGAVAGIFFSPFGIIVGPFLGAVIGELIYGKDGNKAAKAGFGAFLGFLAGTFIKLVVSGLMIYHYIDKLVTG